MFHRFIILLAVAFYGLNVCTAQDIKAIDAAIKSFIARPGMAQAATGFCLMNPDDGKILYQYNDTEKLTPASCLKIVTTGAAFGLLGKEHKFYSLIGYDGTLDASGILHGDLIIKGGGDPMLGSERLQDVGKIFTYQELKKILYNGGIKHIEGRLLVDDSYFDDPGICSNWGYDDIGNYFGAGCFGLNYRDNTYKIELQAGNHPGDTVHLMRVMPANTGLIFENRLTSGSRYSGDASNIFGDISDPCRVLQGTIEPSKKPFIIKGALPYPPEYFAKDMASQLFNDQMLFSKNNWQLRTCKNPVPVHNFVCIDSFASPWLNTIVWFTNSWSINLYAEAMLKETGKVINGSGSSISGIKAVKKFWGDKGIDTTGMYMEDGSGLSKFDRVSALQLAAILSVIKKESYFDDFRNSLPVSGESGAMKGMGKGSRIQSKMYCKTGHLGGVRAYSGYLQTHDGKWLCFSLIVNTYDMSSSQIHDAIQKVLETL